MNLLAFDTSSEYLSLALSVNGRVYSRDSLATQQHSAWLLPWIRQMLDEAGIALADLDAIAFGNGPGAFTGLRIGAGVAQGLALGAGKKLIPLTSLLTLAEDVAEHEGLAPVRVISCLDARMQQVYLAAYEYIDQQWQEVIAPGLFDLDQLPAVEGQGWIGVGSGFDAFPDIAAHYAAQLSGLRPGLFPHARAMLRLGLVSLSRGETVDAGAADLLYLRNKVARTLNERAGA